MSSGEFLGAGTTERLATITECWLDAASQLVSARGSEEFEQASRMYVLTLLARVEWEESETNEVLGPEHVAGRLNDLYNDGIDRTLTDRRRHWYHLAADHDHDAWQRYIDAEVYPCIDVKRGVAAPQTHYDILMYLQSKQARWQSNRSQPRSYKRSA